MFCATRIILIPILLIITSLKCWSQPGVLDPTFGINGKVTLDFLSEVDEAKDIAVQADGKILVAGRCNINFINKYALVRYNLDGTLDNSFSDDGIATVQFGNSNINYGECMALQSNGKIVVAGSTFSGNGYELGLVRFNTDGSLDNTFSGDGLFTYSGGTNVFCDAIAIEQDGSIIVAGASGLLGIGNQITLLRVLSNGTVDTNFGGTGLAIAEVGNESGALGVVIQSDGKIAVAGRVSDGTYNNTVIVRFLSSGFLDNSFSGDGILAVSLAEYDDYATGILQLNNGKLVVSGISNTEFTILQLNSNGSFNNAFSSDGIVATDMSNSFDELHDLAIDNEGNISAVGHSGYNIYDIAVLRYLPDGTLDNLFSLDGKTTIDFSGTYDYAYAVALQLDGKILVAGTTDNNGNVDFAIARLQAYCQPISSNQNASICQGETFSVGNSSYTQSGVYSDLFTAPSGCDSTVITTLEVRPNFATSQNVSINSGESYTVGSNTYTTEGTFEDVFTASNGCDSVVTTVLTVVQGLNHVSSESLNLKVWPVPFNNQLIIEGTLPGEQIQFFDLTGKLIFQVEAQLLQTIVNTDAIENGSYIVSHTSKTKFKTARAFKLQ